MKLKRKILSFLTAILLLAGCSSVPLAGYAEYRQDPSNWQDIDAYNKIAFPNKNPIITPILPNLFNIPAIIPEIAYTATTAGSFCAIIPNVTPIVTPAVVPTNTPFFHPNINTIKILNIFLIDNPNIPISPNADIAIDINKLAPITSSIENARFSVIS